MAKDGCFSLFFHCSSSCFLSLMVSYKACLVWPHLCSSKSPLNPSSLVNYHVCAALPCNILELVTLYFCQGSSMRGRTHCYSCIWGNHAFVRREYASFDEFMLTMRTRMHHYESVLCPSHKHRRAAYRWRLWAAVSKGKLEITPNESK